MKPEVATASFESKPETEKSGVKTDGENALPASKAIVCFYIPCNFDMHAVFICSEFSNSGQLNSHVMLLASFHFVT